MANPFVATTISVVQIVQPSPTASTTPTPGPPRIFPAAVSTRLGLSIRRSSTIQSTATSSSITVGPTSGIAVTEVSRPSNTPDPQGGGDHSSNDSGSAKDASEYALAAVIIGSVTLLLGLTAVAMYFVIRRRRRNRRREKEKKELSSPATARGELSDREWDEESAAGAFNALNMVAAPGTISSRNIVSMADSQSGSLATTANPPPPYRNNQSRSDLLSLGSPVRRRFPSYDPVTAETSRVLPGGIGVNPLYDLETVARVFPSTMTVLHTFHPMSADELQVSSGDKLQVVGIFNDGWTLCRTGSGKKGVIPLACLDLPAGMQSGWTHPVRETTGGAAEELIDIGPSGNSIVRILERTESGKVVINPIPEETENGSVETSPAPEERPIRVSASLRSSMFRRSEGAAVTDPIPEEVTPGVIDVSGNPIVRISAWTESGEVVIKPIPEEAESAPTSKNGGVPDLF